MDNFAVRYKKIPRISPEDFYCAHKDSDYIFRLYLPTTSEQSRSPFMVTADDRT